MAKRTENDDNLKKYQAHLAKLQSEGKLTPPPELPAEALVNFLAKEGHELLKKEPLKKVDEKPKLDAALMATSKNPYVRARLQVLMKYPEWRRDEVAVMEKKGNTDNKHYLDFVREVRRVGDLLDAEDTKNKNKK